MISFGKKARSYPPVFSSSLRPEAPPVAFRVVLTDCLAVTTGGDVLDGCDHFVVTVVTLSHVTWSQGGRRCWGCGCGGCCCLHYNNRVLWGRIKLWTN